jgi:nucleoid-associated protein YgaU
MPKPAPAPAKKAPAKYKVVAGDTLTSIAARHKTTAAALYTYNTTPGVRSAADIATIKRRGPDLIYPGETILIPQ